MAAGRLTQAQADEMLARAKDAPSAARASAAPASAPAAPAGRARGEVLDEVAAKLKLSEDAAAHQAARRRRSRPIAKAQGVSRRPS